MPQTIGSQKVYFPTKIPNGIETSQVVVQEDALDQSSVQGAVQGFVVPPAALINTLTTASTIVTPAANETYFVQAGVFASGSGTETFTVDLPPATLGLSCTVIRGSDLLNLLDITINPDGIEVINFQGAAAASVVSSTTGLAGDVLKVVCVLAGEWIVETADGIWA